MKYLGHLGVTFWGPSHQVKEDHRIEAQSKDATRRQIWQEAD